jgi:hypothetical protein
LTIARISPKAIDGSSASDAARQNGTEILNMAISCLHEIARQRAKRNRESEAESRKLAKRVTIRFNPVCVKGPMNA